MPLARRSAPVRCACSLQSLGRKPVRNSHSSSSRFRSFIPAQYHFHRNSTIIKLAPMGDKGEVSIPCFLVTKAGLCGKDSTQRPRIHFVAVLMLLVISIFQQNPCLSVCI